MYIIKNITTIDNTYLSSKIIDHTFDTIKSALALLEICSKNYVKEQFGQVAYDNSKIIDILNLDQIVEPQIDGILLYRLIDDPHRIHVYERRTKMVEQSGWLRSYQAPTPTFNKTGIYELEEYEKVKTDGNPESRIINNDNHLTEMVTIGNIKIPKIMTIQPMASLISELKQSKKFLEKLSQTI